jgi:hypothetical protein
VRGLILALTVLAASTAQAEPPPEFEAYLLERWPELATSVSASLDPAARCNGLLQVASTMRASLSRGVEPSNRAALADFEWTSDRTIWNWILEQDHHDSNRYAYYTNMYGRLLSGMDDTLVHLLSFYRRDRDDCLALAAAVEG